VNKVIITGSPGTGKSTLLAELASCVEVAEEVSRALILSEREKSSDISPWGNVKTFANLALERMLAQYQMQESSCCVYDRAIPDLMVSLLHRGASVESIYERAVKDQLAGSVVFFAPPWEEIYVSDDLRPETFEQTLSLSSLTREVYQDLGFDLIELEKTTPSERAIQMKQIIKNYTR